MGNIADVMVIVCYFIILLLVGWFFRSFNKSTSDYFRSGGKMLWWMVGASAFMTQFSALTFTGHMGKAFNDGGAVMAIFLGNAFGYYMNYKYFAKLARQTRVVTPMESIRLRFGKVNEQIYTWLNLPVSIIRAGVMLSALAIFVSSTFSMNMTTTIILVGTLVTLMSFFGGSWAVVASDYVQMLTIMAVSIVTSIVAIVKGGGVTPILANGLPKGAPIAGNGITYIGIFVLWVVLQLLRTYFTTNGITEGYRYLYAKDSDNAQKGALLACFLMLIGTVIWFIPAWYMAWKHPDTSTWGLSQLSNITDGTYLAFVRLEMPTGMVGLMMAAVFAATMSTMDSGLNRNSGIFVRSFIKPIVKKDASDELLLKIAKLSTLGFGALIILAALYVNTLKAGLFGVMLSIGALVGLPLSIPSVLGFVFKKTPDWSAWATLIVGAIVSFISINIITPDFIQNALNLETAFTQREIVDLNIIKGILGHIVITCGFFISTTLFYDRTQSEERKKELDEFYKICATPVEVNNIDQDDQIDVDNKQRIILGRLICVFGTLIISLTLIPNPIWGRITFLSIASIVYLAGGLLIYSARPKKVILEPKQA